MPRAWQDHRDNASAATLGRGAHRSNAQWHALWSFGLLDRSTVPKLTLLFCL